MNDGNNDKPNKYPSFSEEMTNFANTMEKFEERFISFMEDFASYVRGISNSIKGMHSNTIAIGEPIEEEGNTAYALRGGLRSTFITIEEWTEKDSKGENPDQTFYKVNRYHVLNEREPKVHGI